jgi:hypothetical protein
MVDSWEPLEQRDFDVISWTYSCVLITPKPPRRSETGADKTLFDSKLPEVCAWLYQEIEWTIVQQARPAERFCGLDDMSNNEARFVSKHANARIYVQRIL